MFPFLPKKRRALTMFDIPTDSYNPKTQLPHSIKIGEQALAPLVSIQQVKDYLIVLGAFRELLDQSPSLPRLADRSALQYQIWAQSMLPYYQRRRAARSSRAVLPDAPRTDSPTMLADRSGWPESEDEQEEEGPLSASLQLSESTDSDATLVDDSESGSWKSRTKSGTEEEEEQFLPPLIVLLAWHAHTMRTERYARDTDEGNAYAALRDYPFPLREVAQAILDDTLPDLLAVHGPYRDRPLESTSMDPLDISAAIQHDAQFMSIMYQGRWLESRMFDVDVSPLQSVILRYHGWLDLIRSTGKPSLVCSSHDIELVWRVHRLDTARYMDETERYTGVILGDIRIGTRKDGMTVRRTMRLWKSMFGVPYQ